VEAERQSDETEGGAAESAAPKEEGEGVVSSEQGDDAAMALNKKQQHMSLFGATTKRLGEMWAALEDSEKV
jgi:hypothetical protein